MLPLVPLYLAGSTLRWAGVKPKRLAGPVVSVGNLSAGGTGKTPFVIALAKLLMAQGIAVDVLSRGYGRTGSGADRVDPEGRAEAFGDEPLLIAREAGVPVFVGAKRLEAGALAEREFRAQVHLLDDGFQHRQLYRDVDIVLVNSEDLGDRLLPAGNLREPVSALRRATVFAVPSGDDAAVERLRALGLTQAGLAISARDGGARVGWAGCRILRDRSAGAVFCGVGGCRGFDCGSPGFSGSSPVYRCGDAIAAGAGAPKQRCCVDHHGKRSSSPRTSRGEIHRLFDDCRVAGCPSRR